MRRTIKARRRSYAIKGMLLGILSMFVFMGVASITGGDEIDLLGIPSILCYISAGVAEICGFYMLGVIIFTPEGRRFQRRSNQKAYEKHLEKKDARRWKYYQEYPGGPLRFD